MFKLFKSKKKSKKDKECNKNQNKENEINSNPIIIDKQIESDISDEKQIRKNEQKHHISVDTGTQTNELINNDNQTLISCQPSPSGLTDSQNETSYQHTQQIDNTNEDNNIADQHHSFKINDLNVSFSGADLNRILTSGYLTGDEDMGYLKRCVDLKSPKSPHFHRPPNFSYSNKCQVSHIQKKGNQGLLTSTLSSINSVKKIRHYSASPTRSEESEEAIRLSKQPGGYIPDPEVPKKIESLDWPSPPYPAAVPELRSRSQSASYKRISIKKVLINEDEIDTSNRKILDEIKSSTKVYRKIYDNQHDDYLLKFKRNKNDENYDNDEINANEKLKRELEEISKLENKSGIARMIAKELKAQEKVIYRSIDPWKASRTPSANVEPHQKTRYESPVNASPSRIIFGYNKGNGSYDEGLCSTSVISTSTIHKDGTNINSTTLLCSTPRKGNTLQKQTVPRPGYGLLKQKSTTLPNSSRLINGIPTHKSLEFDTFEVSNNAGSYNMFNDKVNEIGKYIDLRNSHSTRSTPNLMGTPKIYKYAELKIGYKKKLPTDVDRERLERHLPIEELNQLFGVQTLDEFYELPEWKRVELKKKVKLF